MNRTLIDTDILSYYFRGDTVVIENVGKYLDQFDTLEISLITYYETSMNKVSIPNENDHMDVPSDH